MDSVPIHAAGIKAGGAAAADFAGLARTAADAGCIAALQDTPPGYTDELATLSLRKEYERLRYSRLMIHITTCVIKKNRQENL
jgi:hypothetical protein